MIGFTLFEANTITRSTRKTMRSVGVWYFNRFLRSEYCIEHCVLIRYFLWEFCSMCCIMASPIKIFDWESRPCYEKYKRNKVSTYVLIFWYEYSATAKCVESWYRSWVVFEKKFLGIFLAFGQGTRSISYLKKSTYLFDRYRLSVDSIDFSPPSLTIYNNEAEKYESSDECFDDWIDVNSCVDQVELEWSPLE